VVTGAASPVGRALATALIAFDAEVHAIDRAPVDVIGLASRTVADVTRDDDARAAAARIGAVVDCVFDCAALERGEPSAFVDACAPTLAPHSVVIVASAASPLHDDESVDDTVADLLRRGAA
jgi:nucleoside-diphosphate-sugar epimerase